LTSRFWKSFVKCINTAICSRCLPRKIQW
ncbi:beta-eliminating lyase family protein, partial [Vibrio parahaemolyticus AQ3810]